MAEHIVLWENRLQYVILYSFQNDELFVVLFICLEAFYNSPNLMVKSRSILI